MSVALYMDHHISGAVTAGLRRRGVDVITAFEDGTADWADELILQRATELGRAVYTQDDDFLGIAHQWLVSGREFAGLIYVHQRSITVGQAIADLELLTNVLDQDEMFNRIEFLPV